MIITRVFVSIVALMMSHISYCTSQELSRSDFKIGKLALRSVFSSIELSLGKPDSVTADEDYPERYTGHYYRKLVVWTDNRDKRVCAVDVYDPAMATRRGIRIGDPVSKIKKLYPYTNWVVKKFSRIGPYDYFAGYDQAIICDDRGWYLIFFMKNDVLVKILFYVGVPE